MYGDGNDDLFLQVRSGAGVALQPKREVAVASGDAILLSNAEVVTFTFASAGRLVGVSLPQIAIKPLLRDVDAAFLHTVPGNNEALRLLESYIRALPDDRALATRDLRRMVVAHVHDLAALVLGATRDAAELADQRGVRAARLRAIRADVANGLDRGDELSVGKVAARHRVTPRYVQMLFEGEGTTFTRFVLAERLERARRMLTDPLAPDRGIATVAFDAGFGDLSYFIAHFAEPTAQRPRRSGSGPRRARALSARRDSDAEACRLKGEEQEHYEI